MINLYGLLPSKNSCHKHSEQMPRMKDYGADARWLWEIRAEVALVWDWAPGFPITLASQPLPGFSGLPTVPTLSRELSFPPCQLMSRPQASSTVTPGVWAEQWHISKGASLASRVPLLERPDQESENLHRDP